MTAEITIRIKSDGHLKASFTMPEGLKGDEREDHLRSVGKVMVDVFDKEYLPHISESFSNGDPDAVFVSKFVQLYLELVHISGHNKADADAPLIPPSQVFTYGDNHD